MSAKAALGDDFISPDEVSRICGWNYSRSKLTQFCGTFPQESMLQKLKKNGFILVARPESDQSLVSLVKGNLSHSKKDEWYTNKPHKFPQSDLITAGGWLMIRKGSVPNALGRGWKEQSGLIQSPEYVPNLAELYYAISLYRKARGVYLLPNILTRTSSVDASGHNVSLGNFHNELISVEAHWNDSRSNVIGLASALMY